MNYRHRPKRVNFLKFKVLSYFIVPNIPLVQKLLSKLIGVILSWLELKVERSLSLQTACDIGMVAVVKALLLKQSFNSINVVNNINRQVLVLGDVLIERYDVNSFDFINEIS